MGNIQVFTKNQEAFLHLVTKNEYIMSRFYFTGGTALSAYYLHHRYSDDLDFFSERKVETDILLPILTTWSQELGFTFTARFIEVVYRCVLTFPSGTPLKVDFSYYPYKRLQPSKIMDGIPVDSRFDIAVNKLITLSQRADIKDFVDCYFLWRHEPFYDLVHGMEQKFHISFEPLTFAEDLLMVEDATELPKMITPVKLDDLKLFFRQKAKQLGKLRVE